MKRYGQTRVTVVAKLLYPLSKDVSHWVDQQDWTVVLLCKVPMTLIGYIVHVKRCSFKNSCK